GYDRLATLATFEERVVAGHVQLTFLDRSAVAKLTFVDKDRLDILVVKHRLCAIQLDHADRLIGSLGLVLGQHATRQESKEAQTGYIAHDVVSYGLSACPTSPLF